MHFTAAYSVFHHLIFSSSFKSLNNQQLMKKHSERRKHCTPASPPRDAQSPRWL